MTTPIDSSFLEEEVHHLWNHVVIVNFVGKAPELHGGWLRELQGLIALDKILLHCEAGWGFSYIRLDSLATTRKVLSLIPHKFTKGVALFQGWILGFDPRCLVGLTILVWISLCLLPLEYLDFACELAGQVGKVLEEDYRITVT